MKKITRNNKVPQIRIQESAKSRLNYAILFTFIFLFCFFSVTFISKAQSCNILITTVTDHAGCGINDGAIGLFVSGGTSPYTYLWSGPAGFTATTQNIFNLTGATGIAYTVVVTDAMGCSGTQPFIVEANECCQTPGYTDFATTIHWNKIQNLSFPSNPQYTVSGGQYSLNQNLVIPEGCTVTFSNCTLEINRRIRIQLLSGAGLKVFDNSIFRSCNKMWQGITTNSTTTGVGTALIHVKNSAILDADKAIFAVDGYEVWTENAFFNNNIVGIEMPNYFFSNILDPDVQQIGLNIFIEGTTFTHVGPLKPPFVSQVPYKNTPKAGIILRNFNEDPANMRIGKSIWVKNVFSNMNTGIQFINCAAPYLNNCSFENIHSENFYSGKYWGSAIYCQNGDRSLGLTVSPVTSQSLINPTIKDCDYGVYSNHAGLTMSNVTMTGMIKGIIARNSAPLGNYLLSYNNVYAYSKGIELDYNAKATSISVFQNNIYTNSASGIGISVVEQSIVTADPFYINYNHLYGNGSMKGIDLLNVSNASVRYNKIYSYSSLATNFTGINISGGKLNEITNNEIYGIGPTPPNPVTKARTHGLRFSKSSLNTISCNKVDNTTYGIAFYGELPENDFAGNEMNHHFEGLHLHTDAVIGPQQRRGNTWLDPSVYTYGAYGAVNLNTIGFNAIKKSEFKVQQATSSTSVTYLPTIPSFDAGWFTPDPGPTYSCCPTCAAVFNSDEITQIDIAIAQGDTITSEWTQESFNMAEMYLYKKLDDHPELLNVDPILQSFYSTHTNLATGLLNLVANKISAINAYTMYYEGLINSADSLIAVISDSVNIIDSIRIAINNDTIYIIERNYLVIELLNMDTVRVNINLQKNAFINDAIIEAYAENANLIPIELPEMNEQMVNELYLMSLSPEFTAYSLSEANRLFYVAQQCPYSGGPAVYWARAIYKEIDDVVIYDDFTACLAQGIFRHTQTISEKENKELKFLPNPARDKVEIQFNREKDVEYSLNFFDNVGRFIKNINFSADNATNVFSTSDLASGMYVIELQVDNLAIAKSKLIIIK